MQRSSQASLPGRSGSHDSQDKRRSIETTARAALASSYYPALRRVSCQYDDGMLTVSGKVPTYYLKQLVLSQIHRCLDGTSAVRDNVEVVQRAI